MDEENTMSRGKSPNGIRESTLEAVQTIPFYKTPPKHWERGRKARAIPGVLLPACWALP